MQSHVYAPLGLSIRNKWSLGGTLPGEARESVEMGLGVPREGLWLREDVDMRCNILMAAFVRKTLKKAHRTLVARLMEKAHLNEAERHNAMLLAQQRAMSSSGYGSGSDRDSVSSYAPSSPGFGAPPGANPHDSMSSVPSQGSRASYGYHSDPHQIHFDPQAQQGVPPPPPPPRYSQSHGYAGPAGGEGKSASVWAMGGERNSGRMSYLDGQHMGGMGGQQLPYPEGGQMGQQPMGGKGPQHTPYPEAAHIGYHPQPGPGSPQATRPHAGKDEKGWETWPVELPGREGKGPVELE